MKTKGDIYFNFMLNLLVGENLQAVDKYLNDNLDPIMDVKNSLLENIGYEPKPIYRGVIMQKGGLHYLPPHNNMRCLSFSEDLSIAKIFADPAHSMAVNFAKFENNYGYIIERVPSREEILFHHEFLNLFPDYNKYLLVHNIDGSTMPTQKEVTILQPADPLTVQPIIFNNEKQG